ncbi:MAG: DUF11 domain-containing protein [Planctomycetota bacterium]
MTYNPTRYGSDTRQVALPCRIPSLRIAVALACCCVFITTVGCGTLLPYQQSPTSVGAQAVNSPAEQMIAESSKIVPTKGLAGEAVEKSSENGVVPQQELLQIRTVAYNQPPNAAVASETYATEDCEYCNSSNPSGYPLPPCACGQSPAGQLVPAWDRQEYIFDGGDQEPTVMIRKDWSSAGVNPTDTVVYYETETGKVCVQPTNRVPIYAPRFGSVRQIAGVFLAERTQGAMRVHQPVVAGSIEERDVVGTMAQPLAPEGQQQVHLLDAIHENIAGSLVDGIVPPHGMSEARVAHEGTEVLALGTITDDEIAELGEFIQNAQTWVAPESLSIMMDGQVAGRLSSAKNPAEIYVYEIRDKCALRVCKTASHSIANVGDTVRFTLRFDNAGAKAVRNVVLSDNLSARLQYIEGSQQSSVKSSFTLTPNSVGSQKLTWELEESLKTGEGGTISFDCRVR